MKFSLRYILICAFSVALLSCEKDNYDAPAATLKGKLVYNGEAIGLENYQVPYELYQFGFGKVGPIGSSFDQDGNFSSLLFDGDYKLIIPNGQGPFMWKKTASGAPDSVSITLRGSQELNLDVMPYYMIRNTQVAKSGTSITATFKLEKIITDANAKDVENVTLYINKTQFVSAGDNISQSGINGSDITDPNNISLSVGVPGIVPAQNYVFARVGVKMRDIEDRIYSPLQKIQL